jgi:hypothetical protein
LRRPHVRALGTAFCEPSHTASATTAWVSGGVAHGTSRSVGVDAFRVGFAGSAAPVEADSVTVIEKRVSLHRRWQPVDASLSLPFVAADPDRRAAPCSVAKAIAALAVVRAGTIRHILRPSSGVPRLSVTIVGDRQIERREHLLGRGGAHRLRRLRGGQRHRCFWLGMLDAPSGRCFVTRQARCDAGKTQPCSEREPLASQTSPVYLRSHGPTHAGFLPPRPPRKR